jgi:glycine/D-amino acid oxidase-like deaminating enzyme
MTAIPIWHLDRGFAVISYCGAVENVVPNKHKVNCGECWLALAREAMSLARSYGASQLHDISDAEALEEYRKWSEDHYCAGFISPTDGTVDEFIAYMKEKQAPSHGVLWDYELEFLVKLRKKCPPIR